MTLGQPARQTVHLEAEDSPTVSSRPNQRVSRRSFQGEHRATNCAGPSRGEDASTENVTCYFLYFLGLFEPDIDELYMSSKSPSNDQIVVAR